ncbi:MAG: hypothetical protein ACI9IL_000736 [Rickettsiales bacterium]|jgi:hypothetical protein
MKQKSLIRTPSKEKRSKTLSEILMPKLNSTPNSNKYKSYEELEIDLNKFLIYYNFDRRMVL